MSKFINIKLLMLSCTERPLLLLEKAGPPALQPLPLQVERYPKRLVLPQQRLGESTGGVSTLFRRRRSLRPIPTLLIIFMMVEQWK